MLFGSFGPKKKFSVALVRLGFSGRQTTSWQWRSGFSWAEHDWRMASSHLSNRMVALHTKLNHQAVATEDGGNFFLSKCVASTPHQLLKRITEIKILNNNIELTLSSCALIRLISFQSMQTSMATTVRAMTHTATKNPTRPVTAIEEKSILMMVWCFSVCCAPVLSVHCVFDYNFAYRIFTFLLS